MAAFLTPSLVAPVSTYVGQVTNRCRVPTATAAPVTGTWIQCRIAFTMMQSTSTIRLVFPNFATPDAYFTSGATGSTAYSDSAIAGNATITAAIEYPAGTMTQVTWGGATSVVVPSGALAPPSDPITAPPKGATGFWRCLYQCAGGIPFNEGVPGGSPLAVASQSLYGDGNEFGTGTPTDKTMSGTIGYQVAGIMYGPCAIIGATTAPSVLLFGDSRDYGVGDALNSTSPDTGQIARSLYAGGIPFINAGVAGDSAYTFTTLNSSVRQLLQQYVTHVQVDFGINDISPGGYGHSLAVAKTAVQRAWSMFPSKKIMASTLLPGQVTSTDNFATAANQTVSADEATRQSLNAWLRSVPSPLVQVWDIASALEDGANPGKWKSNGTANYSTIDGLHPSPAGNGLVVSAGVVNAALIVR